MASKLTLSVSQLNEYVRRVFQLDPMLRMVELRGEISNLKMHQTGMLFFTMKDEQASISCVMYPEEADKLRSLPFEGMRATATGSVTLYAKGGQYQFVASSIRPQGVGVLYERLLELKERLGREGLFDRERKRPLPICPDTIGVVTSPTGAVIHDILNVSMRRNPNTRILLCPARVQGVEAADEVVDAIHLLEQLDFVSVIIVARGGGSMEDLWTFNEERVVRAVAACRKPVVSAIGHETDVTLCDLAADLRAPTPSAAAECVIPRADELSAELDSAKDMLREAILGRLEGAQTELTLEKARLNAAHPRQRLAREEAALRILQTKLAAVHPGRRIESENERLRRLSEDLRRGMERQIVEKTRLLNQKERELALLSPFGVLSRGYAIVMKNGAAVDSIEQLEAQDEIVVRMRDGTTRAVVQERKIQGEATEYTE